MLRDDFRSRILSLKRISLRFGEGEVRVSRSLLAFNVVTGSHNESTIRINVLSIGLLVHLQEAGGSFPTSLLADLVLEVLVEQLLGVDILASELHLLLVFLLFKVHGLVGVDIVAVSLGISPLETLDIIEVTIELLRGMHLGLHLRLDLRIGEKLSKLLGKLLELVRNDVDLGVNLTHLELHLGLINLELASGIPQLGMEAITDLALLRLIGNNSLGCLGNTCSG